MSDSEHHQFHLDKARRSSILKPVKVDNRAPLQELGACSDDTTATSSSIYKKRVSFHVINIKEFSSHAQTQEVQKNPAYNEFLSSMSDSSRNNTNSECSNFSPMVPTIVIPPDDDKENQINYGDDSDSLVEDDTSEIIDLPGIGDCNEPFDLSTRYKHEEPRNFLESTKLSNCNTIMSTFNISGIQNLDETSMQALDDESDADDSFQKMIDQQLVKQAGLNFYKRQSMANVARDSVSSGQNMFAASSGRNSFGRKSLATRSVRHEDSGDDVELTCQLPSLPNALIKQAPADFNESGKEQKVTPPRRKSFKPRKSVNFENRNFDGSAMEEEETLPINMKETDMFPRKSVGPCPSTEANESVPDKGDFMWRRSLPNEQNVTKSMEISNTSQLGLETRKSTGLLNLKNTFPQEDDQDSSSMEFTTFVPQKSLRKSVGRILKASENLDESGMEMTEVLHGLLNASASMSDMEMEISNSSPVNVTNTNQSMMAIDQTKFNANDDFTIATDGAQNLNRESTGPRIQCDENGEHLIIKHLTEYPTSTNSKSFSGFENSAIGLSTALHRKSEPISMVSAQDVCSRSALNKCVSTLPQLTSKDGSNSAIGTKPTSNTSVSMNAEQDNSNKFLNSSVDDQSLHTSYITTDINSILPMAHSTNLNLSELKSTSVAKTTTVENSATENNADTMPVEKRKSLNVTSKSNQNESAVNMSICTISQNTELVSNRVDNMNMNLSSVIKQNNARELNLSEKRTAPDETNTCQQPTQLEQANTNMSTNDISMQIESRSDTPVACEDMSRVETVTIHTNETLLSGAISPEIDVLVSDVKNISIEKSNNNSRLDSDSAILSSSSGGSKDNSVVKQNISAISSEGRTGENLENGQISMDTTKPENKTGVFDKMEPQKALQVSADDGFSSTQNSRQSLESGVSPFTNGFSKMPSDLCELERSRKRPSDGFEVHTEHLVQDENKMVVANPKKKLKTFEVDIGDDSKEVNEVEINSENTTKECPMSHEEKSQPITEKQSLPTAINSESKSPSMITPGNRTPTLVINCNETVDKPFNFVTPGKTYVGKTSSFMTPGGIVKTPQFITPGKTPNKNSTFRTPGKTPIKTPTLTTPGRAPTTDVDINFSHESLNSFNISTYVNPSSTLTDSVINNITDRDLPIGSTMKPTTSEMKAKQPPTSVSCSTPLLPNSCNKNVVVDRFFQSIDKGLEKPEGFGAPSKKIIKKLIMSQEGQNQAIEEEKTEDTVSSDGYVSNETKSPSQDTSPENASPETNPTLKRTKGELNISQHNDLNSSNYIPEKQQRNASLNMSQQSVIENVVKDISVLEISGEVEKLTQIQTELAFSLDISDPQSNKIISESIHDDESNLPYKTSGLKDISMVSVQHESPKKSEIEDVEAQHSERVEVTSDIPIENKSIDLNVSEVHNTKQKTCTEPQDVYMSKTPMIEENLDEENKSHNESANLSMLTETSFNMRKKRKSRLSILPKPSGVETTRQMDTKRKTLKIAPKKSVMRQSLVGSKDDSIEEVDNQAEQNILTEEKRGKTEWKSKSLEPELWEFEFFFQGLIVLSIEFNPVSKSNSRLRRQEKSVKRIMFETNEDAPIKHSTPLPPNSSVLSMCYSLLHTKYPRSLLSGMCTTSSDVLPLLQHISPFMSYLTKFARSLQYCQLKYGMKLDGTKATINITSWDSLEWSQVSVNLKDIHFVTSNDIHVKKMFGKLAESHVRRQFPIFSTKDNPTFMRTFIENIYSFINKTT